MMVFFSRHKQWREKYSNSFSKNYAKIPSKSQHFLRLGINIGQSRAFFFIERIQEIGRFAQVKLGKTFLSKEAGIAEAKNWFFLDKGFEKLESQKMDDQRRALLQKIEGVLLLLTKYRYLKNQSIISRCYRDIYKNNVFGCLLDAFQILRKTRRPKNSFKFAIFIAATPGKFPFFHENDADILKYPTPRSCYY